MGQYDNYNSNSDPFYNDFGGASDMLSFNPQPMQRDTFKQRNDPQELLHRFKLQLMNAYEQEIETTDEQTGIKKVKKVIKQKDGTQPICNKQGVEEIISYVEKFINSHSVQGNIDDLNEYRNRMRYISNDIVALFVAKRDDWEMNLEDCDTLISGTINLIDMFFTRALYNEERKGYGESYKETTHNDNRPIEKQSLMQKLGSFFVGKGKQPSRGGGL